MMKSLLMISYYFPPMGMGGVQRMAKLAKYLPEFGYDVHVLTVKPIHYPAYDDSLLAELPPSVKIYRSGSFDPFRLAGLLHLPLKLPKPLTSIAKSKGGMWPDSKIGWKDRAIQLGQRIIEKNHIDIMLSSSPPITAHLVAMALKEKYGIPWIADFRDIWEPRPPEELYANSKTIDKSYRLLDTISSLASAVTSVNDTIARKISPGGVSLPGGYDEDDFSDIKYEPERETFTLCYMGSIGSLTPIEPFVKAARIAAEANTAFSRQVRFCVIGQNDEDAIRKLFSAEGLTDKLKLIPYQSHKEALRLAATCSVSLLSISAGYELIMTGKILDYFGLPMPVLAMIPPDGEAAKLMETYNLGISVSPNDTTALAKAMIDLFAMKENGKIWPKGKNCPTRHQTAQQFALLCDRVTDE